MTATALTGWALGVGDSFRLARRVLAAYWLLTGGGTLVLLLAVLASEAKSSDRPMMLLAFGGALVGVAAGQLVALARIRIGTFLVLWTLGFIGGMLVAGSSSGGDVAAVFALATMGILSGFFSLQHRLELVAVFWATVCWIGAIIGMLNSAGRVAQWRANKLSAWLPITLLMLGGYLATILFYLVAKHSYRLTLWQATAAPAPAPHPGHVTAPKVALLSRRNWLPLLVLSVGLFAFTATVAPYLWRTAEGDQSSQGQGEPKPGDEKDFGTAMERALRQLERAAERSVPLWLVILLSLLLNRPVRRVVYAHRLRYPLERVAPTRRVEQLWRYILLAAGDAGVRPAPADSPREVAARIAAAGRADADVDEAAKLYERARYGLGLPAGDAKRMEPLADRSFAHLRRNLSLWQRLRSWYRKVT